MWQVSLAGNSGSLVGHLPWPLVRLLTLDVDDSFGRCLFGTIHSLCGVVFAGSFISSIVPTKETLTPRENEKGSENYRRRATLLAIIALSAVQSSTQTFIHNAILFINTTNNAWYNEAHWLIGTPYLSTLASNEKIFHASRFRFHWMWMGPNISVLTFHVSFNRNKKENFMATNDSIIIWYCHRASWGSGDRCKTRGRMEIITITAVLFN